MSEKFTIEKVAPLPRDAARTSPHVAVWVRHEGSLSVFEFPATTPQSHILVQIRHQLRMAKHMKVQTPLAELAGKEFDL